MAYQTRQGLPDGWVAQWDPRYERYFYVNEKSSKPQPQWDCPVPNLNIPPPPSKEHSAPTTEPPPPYTNSAAGGPSSTPAGPAGGSGDRGLFSRLHHGGSNQQPYYGGQPGYGGYPPYGGGPGYPAGPPGPGYGYAPAGGYGSRPSRFGGGGGGLLSNPLMTGLGGLAAGGLAMHAFDDVFDRDNDNTVVENNYYGDDGYGGNGGDFGGGDFGGGDFGNNDFDGGGGFF